jgi:hypothetical protein
MRDFFIILIGIVIVFAITGYVNSMDIRRCIERGNAEQTCARSFNR